MPNIENVIAQELGISPRQVAAVVALVDEGNTIPFIARYRKEVTGGLDDVTPVSYTHLILVAETLTLLVHE